MKRAHRWKEFQSPFAWGPRNYDKKLESQERPDCAMGLDYKSDLHSVGTGQGWDVGDVIRFALGSHFGLHLGKRGAQCLREGPEMLLGLLIFPFFFKPG